MRKHIFVLVVFTLLTIIITFPLIFHLSDYVFGKGDELLITWIMNWNIHSFINHPLEIFNANIFYPYKNSLSFSDNFITSSLIGWLPYSILKEPMSVYNFNVLATIIFNGFFTHLFVYYISRNLFSSFISGLLFTLSPFILGRLFQLQVVTIYWIPLGMLFFMRFLEKYSSREFFFACFFFLLQTANSFLPGYFIVVIYLVTFFYLAIKKQIKWKLLFQKNIFLIILLTAFIVILIGYPYLKTSKTFNYVRNIKDTIHFANRPEYFLFPNDKTRLHHVIINTIYKNDQGPFRYDGYWGLGIILLSFFSLFILKTADKKLKKIINITFFVALFSFILSLGPVLQWSGKVIKHPFFIPLPYAILYYTVPGFQGFRNSSRWEVLTVLMISIMIGLIITTFLEKKGKKISLLFTIFISLIIIAEINIPFAYQSIPVTKNFPLIHQYVRSLPKESKILYLPIYAWYIQPFSNIEFEREYYSTIHFKPMINGYSGYSPLPWEKKVNEIMTLFPNKKIIEYLKKIGITHIIINTNEYKELNIKKLTIDNKTVISPNNLLKEIDKYPQLKLIKIINDNFVYKLIGEK